MEIYNEYLKKIRDIALESDRLNSTYYFLMWDLCSESISQEAKPYRENMVTTLKSQLNKLYISRELEECLEFFSTKKIESAVDSATVRELKRLREDAIGVSAEYCREWQEKSLSAQDAWRREYRENIYQTSMETLDELFYLKKKIYGIDNGSVFEHVLKETEWDYSMREIDELFDELKVGLLELCKRRVESCEKVDDSLLWEKSSKEELKSLCIFLVEHMGYDATRGGYGEALHPMCLPLGPDDVRILNEYDSFAGAVFGMLHEGGHAIYFQQHETSLKDTMHWRGHLGMMHESQSRFFENIVGRSEEFWKPIYPKVQELFPKLTSTDFSCFIRMINKVKPSLIRVYADEVTYSLHIIMRYELEKELLDGNLTMDELPKRWNEKLKEYFGIESQDYRTGVLQDPHWALGYIGYFQGYAVGNLYGAQIWMHIKEVAPSVIDKVKEGNMEPMLHWLKENVYPGGSVYTPKDIIKKVTGRELSVQAYLNYLNEKYERIYGSRGNH